MQMWHAHIDGRSLGVFSNRYPDMMPKRGGLHLTIWGKSEPSAFRVLPLIADDKGNYSFLPSTT